MKSAPPYDAQALGGVVAFIGRTGSGKTYAAKGALEPILQAGARVCVLDPTGAWWGLRSSRDGKDVGFSVVVFGGIHADVPIDDSVGAALGRMVGEMDFQCVIDLSEMTMGGRKRFATAFFDAVYHKNRKPLYLVLDEADMFAPQRIMSDETVMYSRVEQIVRRGRIFGFRPWLITQRPAVLNKSVLSQASTLVAMKLTSPQDRAAVKDWIKDQADVTVGKRILADLPRLKLGEGYMWWPEGEFLEKLTFPKIKTFDSSKTPELGERPALPKRLADVDLTAVRAALEAERVAIETNDPKKLQNRIKQLEEALADAGKKPASVDPAAISTAVEQAVRTARASWAAEISNLEAEVRTHLFAVMEILRPPRAANGRSIAAEVSQSEIEAFSKSVISTLSGQAQPSTAQPSDPPFARPLAAPVRRSNDDTSRDGDGHKPFGKNAEGRVLKVLVDLHPARLTNAQWACLSGMKSTTGTWRNYKSKLRNGGLLDETGGKFSPTQAGFDAFGGVPPQPLSLLQVQARWRHEIGSTPSRLLDDLIAAYPNAVLRDELAANADLKSSTGTFRNYVSKLTTNGLAEKVGRDALRATEVIARGVAGGL